MKVFVTGATGYVGKLVVEELLKEGHQVTGLVRSEDSANYLKKLGVRPVIGNYFNDSFFTIIFVCILFIELNRKCERCGHIRERGKRS